MRDLQQCTRCGIVIDTGLDDVDSFEVIELDSGTISVVCEGCITGQERQLMDEGEPLLSGGLPPPVPPSLLGARGRCSSGTKSHASEPVPGGLSVTSRSRTTGGGQGAMGACLMTFS